MLVTDGNKDSYETSFMHKLSVLSADEILREQELSSLAALGSSLPQLSPTRANHDSQQLQIVK